jgi:hypothetical protein
MKATLFLLITSLTLFVGCGSQATLDCTSEATFKQSLDAMAQQLPKESKPNLSGAVMILCMGPIQNKASTKPEDHEMHMILKDYHGWTAQQLIDKAQQRVQSPEKSGTLAH